MGDKYTCGLCLKSTCKGAKAVLCRENYLRWYHLKCKSLSNDSLKKIGKLNILWGCDECVETGSNKSINEVCSEISDVNMDKLIKVLKEQLKSSEFVIKTLNEDLLTAQTEIKKHKEKIFTWGISYFYKLKKLPNLKTK